MKKNGKLLTFVATLLLLSFPFIIWWKAEALTDWWALHNYTAPTAVANLASQTSMTAYGQHIFYVNHPLLTQDINEFRKDCPDSEQTIVLGCYRSNQQGVYIYNVKDARLQGVQQVTSAHEMLHAAYDRLSSKERDHIDQLLTNYYSNDLHDKRIQDTINAYKKLEPNDVVNEMHSIFGTEVANLPAPLEDYYKQYFDDRSKVTSQAKNYEDEFTKRTSQIDAFDAQLGALKLQIDTDQNDLNSQKEKIDADRTRLEALKAANQYDQYNVGVPAYNHEVDVYNALVFKTRTNISTYNSLVEQRNSIASELRSLDKAIDTRSVPATVQ
jgi:hypothetical protein